jgi:hypothetical protein
LLDRSYSGAVSLSRKFVCREDVRWYENCRLGSGGAFVKTGTVSIGKRSNTVYARVYDKRAQMADICDVDIGVERIRFEVSANRGRATLRDFIEPDSLFFSIASPGLVPRPDGVSDWRQQQMDPRTLPPLNKRTDYERALLLVENCTELRLLRDLVDRSPNMRAMIERALVKSLGKKSEAA